MPTLRPNLILSCLALPFVGLASCTDHDGGTVTPLVNNPAVFPVFETRIDVPTGSTTHADAVVGDFDGDGDLDSVVIALGGELQVLLGNGNATFQGVAAQTIGGAPIGMRAADFDGDQDLDLAVLQLDAQQLSVFFNDGSAGFTAGPVLPVGSDAVYLVLADVDGNGTDDVVVSRTVSPELRVFVGDGAGGFAAAADLSMPGGGRPLATAVGDATNDGRPDLLVCDRARGRVLVYAGDPTGGATSPLQAVPEDIPVPGGPVAVSLGDISGDGVNDIVVSVFDRQQLQVITSRAGGSVSGFSVAVDGGPGLSEVVDLTGDGIDDLVCCVQGRYCVSLFPGTGTGFGPELQYDASGLPLRPMTGDFDGDGREDFMVLSGLGDRLNLYLARDEGLVGAQSYETGVVSPEAVTGADFDGDGANEVLVGGFASTEVSVMRYEADPVSGRLGLRPVYMLDVGRPVYNVVAADMNLDGLNDVIAAVDGGVKVLLNRSVPGTIQFELRPADPSQVLVVGTGPYWVATDDMNGDGLLDLAIADVQGDRVLVALARNGDLEFDEPLETPMPGAPSGLVLADFNGDNVPDVGVARLTQARVSTLINDGAGNLVTGVTVPVGAGPTTLRTADFNGDGRADLVVSNGRGGTVTVLFPTGTGFVSTQEYPAGDTPTALLTRDLNADGNTDVLVASLASGDFRVLLGDGDGGFPDAIRFPGTTNVSSGVLLDMDGDAMQDLVLASVRTTRVTMVRNITPASPINP